MDLRTEDHIRERDLFLDIVRHDIYNPASAAYSMAVEALNLEEDPSKRKALKIISKNILRIMSVVDDSASLNMNRKDQTDIYEMDMGDLLREALLEQEGPARKKRIGIDVRSSGRYPVIGRPMLYVVFSNLLSNAVIYSPKDSQIIVNIENNSSSWLFSVTDNGPGIPDCEKERIFSRFVRIPDEASGKGLGLAIVKRIIEIHNGRVWVEDNPNGGSIFYAQVPKSIFV